MNAVAVFPGPRIAPALVAALLISWAVFVFGSAAASAADGNAAITLCEIWQSGGKPPADEGWEELAAGATNRIWIGMRQAFTIAAGDIARVAVISPSMEKGSASIDVTLRSVGPPRRGWIFGS